MSAIFLGPTGVAGFFFCWGGVPFCFKGGGATGVMGLGAARRSWGFRWLGWPDAGRVLPRSRTRVSGMTGGGDRRGGSEIGGASTRGGALVSAGREGPTGGACSVLAGAEGSAGLLTAAVGAAFSGGATGGRGGEAAGSALLEAGTGVAGAEGAEVSGGAVGAGAAALPPGSTDVVGLDGVRPSSGAGRGLVSSTGTLRSVAGKVGGTARGGTDGEPLFFCTSCTT
jgi:hypothetical protein